MRSVCACACVCARSCACQKLIKLGLLIILMKPGTKSCSQLSSHWQNQSLINSTVFYNSQHPAVILTHFHSHLCALVCDTHLVISVFLYDIHTHMRIYFCILCMGVFMCVYIASVHVCVPGIICSECVCLCERDTQLVSVAPCWCPPAASCACGGPCWSSIPPARQWWLSPSQTTCSSRSSPPAPPRRAACVCWPPRACVSHAAKLGSAAACLQPRAVKVHQGATESLFICEQ